MVIDEIKRKLESALTRLINDDELLIMERAHERAMCFRLGYYLQLEFDQHTVDAEYDRQQGQTDGTRIKKTVQGTSRGDKELFPDLLVHTRGCNSENLLAVEVKKIENLEDAPWDREKLGHLLSQPFEYKIAAFVIINAATSDPKYQIEWIEHDT